MVNHPHRAKAKASTGTPTKSPRTVTPRKRLPVIAHNHEADYAALLLRTRQDHAAIRDLPMFTTSARGLFDRFLDNLPGERQAHNCSTCRRFMKQFGGLVAIQEDGSTFPVFWGNPAALPAFYAPAIRALRKAIMSAKVTGPFMCDEPEWGTARTGEWTHLAVNGVDIYRGRVLTPRQAMAQKREDFATVNRALVEFSAHSLHEALRVLEAAALPSSEKFVGPVQWLLDLKRALSAAKVLNSRDARDNVLWRAIAIAPEGYCHPRSSIVGTLLEDIEKGLSFEAVKKNFTMKVDPRRYQRPVAAPKAGNIAQAERVIAATGAERSLERRFARLDECETLWTPLFTAPRARGGVFDHLSPREKSRGMVVPGGTMTWVKFRDTVLSQAVELELYVPSGPQPFIALTTAVHADAPLIFKWKHPVAWYVKIRQLPPDGWGLPVGWRRVTGLVPLPPTWGEQPRTQWGDGVIWVLEGCVDRENSGSALFPECLSDEFHGIRATMEAYSTSRSLAERESASACGMDLRAGKTFGFQVRATIREAKNIYTIDRWD